MSDRSHLLKKQEIYEEQETQGTLMDLLTGILRHQHRESSQYFQETVVTNSMAKRQTEIAQNAQGLVRLAFSCCELEMLLCKCTSQFQSEQNLKFIRSNPNARNQVAVVEYIPR
ncbi:hypothetical protein KC19_VG215100 [Ceratodon purpureus]|uniref:Uncharacterized protein n=1 Tax=Ceratodon purpureus TaxID=3225 RepID=A0A8T0HSW7_CERPU|nr:hypothetical protein KC19_VG215100 [Ceratodon purpureus]